MLAATARLAIDAIVGDRAHPVFVPEINLAMNIFQPNADSVYRSAMIDATGTYRLRGKRGSVSYFTMAQLRDMIRTNQPSAALPYSDSKDLNHHSEENFNV